MLTFRDSFTDTGATQYPVLSIAVDADRSVVELTLRKDNMSMSTVELWSSDIHGQLLLSNSITELSVCLREFVEANPKALLYYSTASPTQWPTTLGALWCNISTLHLYETRCGSLSTRNLPPALEVLQLSKLRPQQVPLFDPTGALPPRCRCITIYVDGAPVAPTTDRWSEFSLDYHLEPLRQHRELELLHVATSTSHTHNRHILHHLMAPTCSVGFFDAPFSSSLRRLLLEVDGRFENACLAPLRHLTHLSLINIRTEHLRTDALDRVTAWRTLANLNVNFPPHSWPYATRYAKKKNVRAGAYGELSVARTAQRMDRVLARLGVSAEQAAAVFALTMPRCRDAEPAAPGTVYDVPLKTIVGWLKL
jgi:hypothetical protein